MSEVRRPRAARISHRQLDQISPSSCSSPLMSFGYFLLLSRRRRHGRLRAAVRHRVPVTERRPHRLGLDVGEEARRQVVAEAFAHRFTFLRRAEPRQLVVLQRVAVFVEDDFSVFRIVHAAGAEGQRLRRRAVERVVVRLPVDMHADRMVEGVGEPEVLDVALCAVDVEVHHDFLERAIRPGEKESPIRPLDAIGRVFRRHVRPVEKPARFQIPQIHLGVGVHWNRRLVLERRVVEDRDRVGIEHAAPPRGLLQQVIPAEDLPARRVQVDLPLGGGLPGLDNDLPRQRRSAARLEVAQLLREDVGFLCRAGTLDGPADGFALGELSPRGCTGWSRRRALSHGVHRRHRHDVVGHVVHVAILVDVDANPRPRDRLAGVILLVRHVFAEDGFADFLVLEVRELGIDLQLRRQTFQRRVRDLAGRALSRDQFRCRQSLRDLANRIDCAPSRQRTLLCHRVTFDNH